MKAIFLGLTICVASLQSVYAADCTNSDLNGDYMFRLSGWNTNGFPFYDVGVVNFDGINRGKIVRAIESSMSLFAAFKGSGRYYVRPECMAVWNVTLNNGLRVRVDLVIAGDDVMIMTSSADTGASTSGTGKKIP